MIGNSATLDGGAIEIINTANFQTFDLTVSQNAAGTNGGGLHVSGNSAVVITRSTFDQNTAAQEGGGFWNGSGGDLFVRDNSLVDANTASGSLASNGGGGIFNDGGEVFINNATISNNQANGSGGGIFTNGGRVALKNNSKVDGNSAARQGGGIESAAVSADPDDSSYVSLDNSTVLNNDAGVTITGTPGNGGGIHTTGSNSLIYMFNDSKVENNEAKDNGGGIWNDLNSQVIIRDGSRVTNNRTNAATPGGLGGGHLHEGLCSTRRLVC